MEHRQPLGLVLLLATLLAATAVAQEQVREQPELPAAEPRVNLPEMIVKEKRWRVPDDIREELWREQLREIERLKRDREQDQRDGAAATFGGNGRMKVELLPRYDPGNPRRVDMQVDESRSEVVELFRAGF